MNKAEEIFQLIKPVFDSYDLADAKEALDQMGSHGLRDINDKNSWGYYQFLPCLMKVLKPKMVVELGGSVGTACLMILTELPKDSILYSINLVVKGEEFSYIKKDYPNLRMIRGDDLDMKNWEGINLNETNIWFIDSDHSKDQFEAELKLYSPFFKPEAIILIDDIHLNPPYEEVWYDLVKGKYGNHDTYDASTFLHWSGFGIIYW